MARGQVIIGALILLGIIIIGGVGSYKIISENRYIGDKDNEIYYDLKFCEIDDILTTNLTSFKNFEEVTDSGYQPAPCSK